VQQGLVSGMLTIGLAEPVATATLLTVFAVLMAVAVFFSRPLARAGVPIVLLFLVLGMLGGSEGLGGVAFDDFQFAFRAGTVALILILFDGGLNTSIASVRRSAAPAGLLATGGVLGTAGALALIGRLLGLSWPEALLIGAIVSSTDAAAVFALLRGGMLRIREKVRSTIEVESCANDPMAVALTVSLVEVLSGKTTGWTGALIMLPLQLIVGLLVGLAVGWLASVAISRIRLSTVGLYPVLTLSAAFLSFGVATLLMGSGFLAVFATALVLGSRPLPYMTGLTRVHDAVAWLSQIGMFMMLGLLVFPSKLLPVAGVGLLLGASLTFIARPLVTTLCLAPLGWKRSEIGYVGWVGIRGAVPIILATFPILGGLEYADRVFHIVFFIVVFSALLPGATIVPLTRKMGMIEHGPPIPSAAIELHSLSARSGDVRAYYIDESVAACGAMLSELQFPEHAAVILIVRGDDLLPARGATRIRAGDFVYVFCREEDEPSVGLLLGRPAEM